MIPPSPAPLSEQELDELERWISTRDFIGVASHLPRLFATVRALQQQNQELQIRVAALDPNHILRGSEVPK